MSWGMDLIDKELFVARSRLEEVSERSMIDPQDVF
jgi:hypothetical protein